MKKKPKSGKKRMKVPTQTLNGGAYVGCVSHGKIRYPIYVAVHVGIPFKMSRKPRRSRP